MGFLLLVLCVMLIILAFTGVVRAVLLGVLTICAPIAFLCLLLPETRTYMMAWRRLFLVAVFSQAIQVLVLRFALMLTFKDSVVSVVSGLVAMYMVLKVPTALHAASSAESKTMTYARHVEHAVQSAIHHAISPPHSRVRAHPAAD